jgi:hypothetical protein
MRTPMRDISGILYDEWTAVARVERSDSRTDKWSFKHTCGNVVIRNAGRPCRLRMPVCRVCHPVKVYVPKNNGHGHKAGALQSNGSPTYISWRKMHVRCYSPNSINYRNYGARGVRVTRRWHDFRLFLKDMGLRPEGTSLGRFLDRGNYSSRTCAWMTSAEQGLNVRNNNALKNWEALREKPSRPIAAWPALDVAVINSGGECGSPFQLPNGCLPLTNPLGRPTDPLWM